MAVLGRVIECLAVLTVWLTDQVYTFNLESRLPVIKLGPKDSYFGFAVAEHQILRVGTNEVLENVLLVGAPRAETTIPGTNHSGAVYKCSITTKFKGCRQLQVDQHFAIDNSVDKEDQWMGVTVKSQGPGKYVMACAHRYVSKGLDYRWGFGACYSLTPDLDFHKIWMPCHNRPVSKAHEQFGYCQAGISGYISEDNNIIIGAPGPHTWRGTVFSNNIRGDIRDGRTWNLGPLTDETAPVEKYSYLGMSVTSGKFFGNETLFASGAPRAKGHGQVVFFKKQKHSALFLVEVILDGKQFASSFGYSLEALDIDNNGYTDLVVGAPFYYGENEGGAIYVYMNFKDERLREPKEPITGKLESRFGFAIANAGDINRDGYVDLAVGAPYEGQGAVYIYLGSREGLNSEPSQVIYARELPKKVLSERNITSFGYSLSGGMDLDDNGYPDLLVGAYDSDAVLLLRSRPVINIVTSVKGKLTNIDPTIFGCPKDEDADLVCFSFEACFQFNSSVLFQRTSFKLRYRIEAETFTGQKYYRVTFNSSLKDTPNIVTKDIEVKEDNLYKLSCSNEIVYLKNKSDIQNPIQFKMTYSLIQKDPVMPLQGAKLPDINQYPILDQVEASKIFEAKFLKDCGKNEICECDLHLEAELNLPKKDDIFEFPLGEKYINMSLKITNTNESAYDTMIYISHSPSLTYGNKKLIKGSSVNCFPEESILKCELNNPMKPGEVEFQIWFNAKNILPEEKQLQFDVKVNTTSTELTPEDDISLIADIIIVAELELRGGYDKEQIFYGGEVIGETGITYLEDIGSKVDHTYVIINNGPATVSQVEIVFSWPYEVANKGEEGKWILYLTEAPEVHGNGYCHMQPDQINPLRYKENPLYQLPTRKPEINLTTGDKENSESIPRQRRKREVVIKPEELRMEGKMVKMVTMDCDIGTAQCFNFSCFIRDLGKEKSARIIIKSRLWSSTFVSDYRDVNFVSIISRGGIRLDPRLGIRQKNLENDRALAESKVQPDKSLYKKPEEVPLWIIILSVCGGVLLLIIVILCLWKFGFFKRRKPGYMPAATSDKEKEANNI